jgi:hypothetical protein
MSVIRPAGGLQIVLCGGGGGGGVEEETELILGCVLHTSHPQQPCSYGLHTGGSHHTKSKFESRALTPGMYLGFYSRYVPARAAWLGHGRISTRSRILPISVPGVLPSLQLRLPPQTMDALLPGTTSGSINPVARGLRHSTIQHSTTMINHVLIWGSENMGKVHLGRRPDFRGSHPVQTEKSVSSALPHCAPPALAECP